MKSNNYDVLSVKQTTVTLQGDGKCHAICTCKHGSPVPSGIDRPPPARPGIMAAACDTPQEKCANCTAGFWLDDGKDGDFKCHANVCSCDFGGVGRCLMCPRHGEPQCFLRCDHARHLTAVKKGENKKLNPARIEARCDFNVCRCKHGTPAELLGACPVRGAWICSKCDKDWYFSVNQMCRPTCKCDHGVAAEFPDCVRPGQNCVACNNKGYRIARGKAKEWKLYGEQRCVPICTCENGQRAPAPDTDIADMVYGNGTKPGSAGKIFCTTPGENCMRCNPGYKIKASGKINKCVPFKCICEHGVPSPLCHSDTAPSNNNCRDCDKGYYRFRAINANPQKKIYMSTYVCKPNQCRCMGWEKQGGPMVKMGEAPIGTDCPANRFLRCKKDGCSEGRKWLVSVKVCEMQMCACPMGFPPPGAKCAAKKGGDDTDLPTKCSQCRYGFFLNNGSQADFGQNSPNHPPVGKRKPVDSQCKLKKCKCEGGRAAMGRNCDHEGNMQCLRCNEGYELRVRRKCLDKINSTDTPCKNVWIQSRCLAQCECRNGELDGAQKCKLPTKKCKSCYQGFQFKAGGCRPQMCKCSQAGRHPAFGAECSVNNTVVCTNCIGGFSRHDANVTFKNGTVWSIKTNGSTGPCLLNECTCRHGSEAQGPPCKLHKMEICAKCKKGYHPDESSVCVLNICKCPNGKPATGWSIGTGKCEKHGDLNCVKCAAGYSKAKNGTCDMKICSCDNGKPETGQKCLRKGATQCKNCKKGYRLHWRKHTCDAVCDCPNGQAWRVRSKGCTEPGTFCRVCDPDHKRVPLEGSETGEMQCIAKCRCTYGKPPLGKKDCPEPKHICVSCDAGFKMSPRKLCIPKVCECENGLGSLGPGPPVCKNDGGQACQQCPPGFKKNKEKTKCLSQAVTCNCTHGIPAAGPRCTKKGANICIRCTEKDYLLTPDYQCAPVCTCKGGRTYKLGDKNCKKPGGEVCKSCFKGWSLERKTKKCLPACICPSGTASKLGTCTKPGQIHCKKCKAGPFKLTTSGGNSPHCVGKPPCFMPFGVPELGFTATSFTPNGRNKCRCPGGRQVRNKDCPIVMLEKCEKCNEGFTIQNDLICLPNMCNCLHGEPAQGADCIPDKSVACSVCYQGYHLTGKRDCAPNTCVCPKGTPARGAACRLDGTVICTSCKPGWFLDVRKFTCGPKICKCKGGEPVPEFACPMAGAERCSSCYNDYSYEPLLMKCLPICSCERGVPPRPGVPPCDKNPGIGCTVCYPGFGLTNVTDPVANYTYVDCLPKCICLDGHPWVGGSPGCITPGPSCEYCNPGYYLYEKTGTCEPNICWCRHGEPADAESNTCLFNKEQRCLSCEEGWAPANVTAPVRKDDAGKVIGPKNTTLCYPKCDCDNGYAANFPQGCNYPKYICHKCYEGFKLEMAKFDPKDPNKVRG